MWGKLLHTSTNTSTSLSYSNVLLISPILILLSRRLLVSPDVQIPLQDPSLLYQDVTQSLIKTCSFYVRSARTWNSLPAFLKNCTSESAFKSSLSNYYLSLTSSIYDPDLPQTFKTVCVKCHQARQIDSLKETLCC